MGSQRGKKRGSGRRSEEGIVGRASESEMVQKTKQAGREAGTVTKKLMRSTGRAAWIAGTSFLVLVLPLIIASERHQMYVDIDLQQQALLGAPTELN